MAVDQKRNADASGARWPVLVALIVLAMVCLSARFPAAPPVWAAGPADLVRIPLVNDGDLHRVLALDLDVLAHVPGAEGTYLVARLPERARGALAASALVVDVLESGEGAVIDGIYYLAESKPMRAISAILPLQVLYDDGLYALVRLDKGATPGTGVLAGLRLLAIGPDPIAVSVAPSGAIPASAPHDPLVAAVLAQVTAGDLHDAIGDLSGEWSVIIGSQPYTLTTRHTDSGEPLLKATQYVYEYVAARGWTASYHAYEARGTTLRNVIGEKTGASRPERIVMLTAHLDSRERTAPHDPAPGADDNASGCAALMLAANLLDDIELAYTVRLVFFTGEEQGMLGSTAYAADVAAAGEEVVGVVNLDMIAWDGAYGPDFDIHTHLAGVENDSDALGRLMAATVESYDLDLIPQVIANGTTYSDHSPFWNHGYAAILSIEDYLDANEGYGGSRDFNPYYHSVDDLLENCHTTYAREMTRAALATVMHLARPVRTLTGTVTDATSGVAVRARVTAQGVPGTYAGWTDLAGSYTLTVPSGEYVVTTSATAYHDAPVQAGAAVTGTGITVDLAPVPGGATMTLAEGWNLTALPRVPGDAAPSVALAPLAGSLEAAYQFDAADNLWSNYHPLAPAHASSMAQLDAQDGLWLWVDGATTCTLDGTPPGACSIDLVQGWNLVPYPGVAARTVTQALASIASDYEIVYAQAAPGDRDTWLWYGPTGTMELPTLATMQPGESYWIKANAACTWMVP